MKHSYLLLAALLTLLPAAVGAGQPIVVSSGQHQTAVVELYTSEGCSSCPPADRWLAQLVQTPRAELDVLALAFHVDYWDYIGWKDEFANPRHTQRQRKLADNNKQRSIYTPEFFVDGEEARGTGKIVQQIQRANQTPSTVDLQLAATVHPDHVQLRLDNQAKTSRQAMQVQFVVFEDDLGNQVDDGENAGRYLRHQRVVRYLSAPLALGEDTIRHRITIPAGWKRDKLGVGAVVKSAGTEYLQSVFTLLH